MSEDYSLRRRPSNNHEGEDEHGEPLHDHQRYAQPQPLITNDRFSFKSKVTIDGKVIDVVVIAEKLPASPAANMPGGVGIRSVTRDESIDVLDTLQTSDSARLVFEATKLLQRKR